MWAPGGAGPLLLWLCQSCPPPEGDAGLRQEKVHTLCITQPNYLLPPLGEGGPGASLGRMRAAPGGNVGMHTYSITSRWCSPLGRPSQSASQPAPPEGEPSFYVGMKKTRPGPKTRARLFSAIKCGQAIKPCPAALRSPRRSSLPSSPGPRLSRNDRSP